jgi:hypothetical protein
MICNTLHLLRGDCHPHVLHDLPTTITRISGIPHKKWSPHHHPSRGGRTSTPRAPECLEEDSGNEPLATPPPIPTIGDWAQMLLTHTHEEFATLATIEKDHTCPPCRDALGVALLRPSQIHHYVYGEWRGTLEIQDCLDGTFKILQHDLTNSLLKQPEIDQILCLGEAPTR